MEVRRFDARFFVGRVPHDQIAEADAIEVLDLVGLRVRRTHRLPWVAHFSDPWVDSPYLRGSSWLRRIWQRMERDVVAQADALARACAAGMAAG